MDQRALNVAIVAGEESGDLLGADLVRGLMRQGARVTLVGVGGRHLQELGLRTLFDPADIALVGMVAILRDLPRLVARITSTARAIVKAKPDCLITIDSPEFSLRVAKKVRAMDPSIPIVHYVCPSVWAWRPARAPAIKPHVDRVLCLLPFEPRELQRLGGPQGDYVGHRLLASAELEAARTAQLQRTPKEPKTLLLLPGSRRSEVSALLEVFGQTVDLMAARGRRFRLVLPTLPHVEPLVRRATAQWSSQPEILLGEEAKWRAFAEADAALAASGTVTLELALIGVPLVSCYKLDAVASMFRFLVTAWSASLPNLIADRPVVIERYQEMVRPGILARDVEALTEDTAYRRWQLDGFEAVRNRMMVGRPAGDSAAAIVREVIAERANALR